MDRINLNIKNNHLQIFSNIVSDDVFGMPVINKSKAKYPLNFRPLIKPSHKRSIAIQSTSI